jgi:hypothetical protein
MKATRVEVAMMGITATGGLTMEDALGAGTGRR